MERGKYINQYITLIKNNIICYGLEQNIDYKLKIIDNRYIIYVACQPIKLKKADELYKQCKGLHKVLSHCVCYDERFYCLHSHEYAEDYFKIFIIDTNYLSKGVTNNIESRKKFGLNHGNDFSRKSDITCWLSKNKNNKINFEFIHDGVNEWHKYCNLSFFNKNDENIKKIDGLEIKDLFLYLYDHQNEIRDFYLNGISDF